MAYVEYEADGKTIKARVWQKVDTLANWEANSLVIGPGEQAFVIDGAGTPINFKIGDGTKRFSELPWWISYDQGQYVQTSGLALPSPTVELGYTFVGPGTYTHAGGNVVAPDGRFSQLVWNGTTWSLKDMGSLPDNSAKAKPWSAGSYEANSIVSHNEIEWIAKVDTSQEPSETAADWRSIGAPDERVEMLWNNNDGSGEAGETVYDFADFTETSGGGQKATPLIKVSVGDIVEAHTQLGDNFKPIDILDVSGNYVATVGANGSDTLQVDVYTVVQKGNIQVFTSPNNPNAFLKVTRLEGNKIYATPQDIADLPQMEKELQKLILNDRNYGEEPTEPETVYDFADFTETSGGGQKATPKISVSKGDEITTKTQLAGNFKPIDFYNEANVITTFGNNGTGALQTDVLTAPSNGSIQVFTSPDNDQASVTIQRKEAGSKIYLTPEDLDNVGLYEGKNVMLQRPKFAELHFDIVLPTDESDARTPTQGTFRLKVDNWTILSAKCALSIQGHGSIQYPKKGYTLDIFNKDGDGLKVKFGNMIPIDSFHLKAFASDRTHARDVGSYKLWADMVRSLDYPLNKINNKPIVIKDTATIKENDAYIADAQYHPDGFPVAIYVNGSFHGLYTLRLKKTRENYALDRADLSHIFLDSVTYSAYLSQAFDHTDWEAKSPRMSGYGGEGAPITDAGVLTNINRLFDFTRQINTRFAEHADYIVLPIWCAFIIHSEVIWNIDTNGNNYNLLTWDGTHWVICPYDLDLTIGLNGWANYTIETTKSGMTINHDIWANFKTIYADQIKTLYTKWRKNGVLSMENVIKIYTNQVNGIPRNVYQDDKVKWPSPWNGKEPVLEHIFSYINSRLNYLDTQWLLP